MPPSNQLHCVDALRLRLCGRVKKQEKDPDLAPRPPGSLGTCFKWALYNDGRWFYTLGSSSASWSGCCGHLEPVPPSRTHAFILCMTEQEGEGLSFCHAAGRDKYPPLRITPNKSRTRLRVFTRSWSSPQFTSVHHVFVSGHVRVRSLSFDTCLNLLRSV